jgi:hypothetical protein
VWPEYKGMPFSHFSNVGVVAPTFFEPEGFGFFRNFTVGLLSTYVLTYCGAPNVDQGNSLGLHGRIGNIPAEEVGYETIQDPDGITFSIKGKVKEAAFFGEHLVLECRITSKYSENKIAIHDQITNLGYETEPLMVLYRFKTGENCADLTYGIGRAGDIDIEQPKIYIPFVGTFTQPNAQFDLFMGDYWFDGYYVIPHIDNLFYTDNSDGYSTENDNDDKDFNY